MARRGLASGIVVVATLLFLFVPLAIVVLFSFHSGGGLTFPFEGFSTRWYDEVFGDATFSDAFVNSLWLGLATAALTLGLGLPAAYGVSRMTSRLRGPLQFLFIAPVLLPGLLIGAALLTFLARVGLERSLLTVLIGHVVFAFPFVFILLKTAIDRLDLTVEEVARDLGATPWKVFRRVTIPQILPVLAGAAALAFMLSFDEFLITFFTAGSDQTLPLYIFGRLRRTVDPGINVASTLLLAITMLLWVVAAIATLRAARTDRAAKAMGVEV
jgi:ABC-type spermidine/putrescine transport system permease subunit II